MMLKMTNDHIAINASNDIQQITKPLLKLGVSYFSYVRSYEDGSHIRLSNNAPWTRHYYDRGFYNVVIRQVPAMDSCLLWNNIDKYPLFHEASEYFNIDNGAVIVVKSDDITERYFFGATRDNTAVNAIYLYRMDLLKRFILYFKEMARDIICTAEKSKIMQLVVNQDQANRHFIQDEELNHYYDQTRIDKMCVRMRGIDYYVSANEAKILSLMKRGYSAKQIAHEIGLSQKTIEIYRDKLKSKFDCFTRNELMSSVRKNTLLDYDLLEVTP